MQNLSITLSRLRYFFEKQLELTPRTGDAGSTSDAAATKPPARAERFVTHFSPAKGLLAAPAAASPYSESPRSLSRAAGREWNGGKHRICIPWTDEEDAFLLQLRGEGGGLLVPSPVKKNLSPNLR